jgi:aspartate/glutamate racemase
MSWESSAQYYRLANELVRERRDWLHSARCVLVSIDFDEIERLISRTGSLVSVFPTIRLHVEAAVEKALATDRYCVSARIGNCNYRVDGLAWARLAR